MGRIAFAIRSLPPTIPRFKEDRALKWGQETVIAALLRAEIGACPQFRSFVAIVEMDGSSIVAQYPAGNGSPLTRDEFLPVITGISTCTDLSALRELIVDELLGLPVTPRRQRGNFVLDHLDTNGDLLLDATDASYLER